MKVCIRAGETVAPCRMKEEKPNNYDNNGGWLLKGTRCDIGYNQCETHSHASVCMDSDIQCGGYTHTHTHTHTTPHLFSYAVFPCGHIFTSIWKMEHSFAVERPISHLPLIPGPRGEGVFSLPLHPGGEKRRSPARCQLLAKHKPPCGWFGRMSPVVSRVMEHRYSFTCHFLFLLCNCSR